MYKTLRLSFSLKNTYRVNSILFAVKQIPLIKKILPEGPDYLRDMWDRDRQKESYGTEIAGKGTITF